MKKKNIIVVVAIVIVVILGILLSTKVLKGRNIESKDKNAIGETDITKKTYGYPLISLLSYNSNVITVDAGYYRFGDVNQDGVIDENDKVAISLIINSQLFFTNGQKKLADVDESGSVDEKDINRFDQYLEKNGKTEYDLNSDTLEYCISNQNDSSTCSWQDSNSFTVKEKSDYYLFVRQKDTMSISESSFFEKSTMDEYNPE